MWVLFSLSFFIAKVLYLLGAMSLSMALQLDRHGLWNLLGPSLFALGIMAVAWVRVVFLICTALLRAYLVELLISLSQFIVLGRILKTSNSGLCLFLNIVKAAPN